MCRSSGKCIYEVKPDSTHRLAFFFWVSIGTQVFTDARDEIKDEIFANVEKIEKFKRLNITIKIKAPLIFIRNVKVESDELYKLLEEDKRIKVLSDGQVNDKKINTYTAYIYLNNIDIKELKKIIGDFNYTITWKNIWNNRSYEKFYIKDYIR